MKHILLLNNIYCIFCLSFSFFYKGLSDVVLLKRTVIICSVINTVYIYLFRKKIADVCIFNKTARILSISVIVLFTYFILQVFNYKGSVDPLTNILILNTEAWGGLPSTHNLFGTMSCIVHFYYYITFSLLMFVNFKCSPGFAQIYCPSIFLLSLFSTFCYVLDYFFLSYMTEAWDVLRNLFGGNFGLMSYRTNRAFLYCISNCFILHFLDYRINKSNGLNLLLWVIAVCNVLGIFLANSRLALITLTLQCVLGLNFYINNRKIYSFKIVKHLCVPFVILLVIYVQKPFERVLRSAPLQAIKDVKVVNLSLKTEFEIKNTFDSNVVLMELTDNFNHRFKKFFLQIILTPQSTLLLNFQEPQNGLNRSGVISEKLPFGRHSLNLEFPGSFAQVKLNENPIAQVNLEFNSEQLQHSISVLNMERWHGKYYKKKVKINFLHLYNGNRLVYDANHKSIYNQLLAIAPNRTIAYKNSVRIFKDNWFYGVGLGSWNAVYNLYRSPGQAWEYWLHNEFFQLLIELGALGFLFAMISIGMILNLFLKGDSNGDKIFFSKFSYLITITCFCFFDFPLHLNFNATLVIICTFVIAHFEKGR